MNILNVIHDYMPLFCAAVELWSSVIENLLQESSIFEQMALYMYMCSYALSVHLLIAEICYVLYRSRQQDQGICIRQSIFSHNNLCFL